jgi:nitroimidazol reductase NimA-like FMN-containing flavoprotein (pyridoxamine 5'-phosphate oxidase superfamily)
MSTRSDAYFEFLSREDCLRLLPTVPVGWFAYCQGSRPELVPVNFLVYEGEVVARTTYGSKLAAAAHGAWMTFGVDELDPVTETGWSVTATGRGRLIEDLDELAMLDLSPLQPWAPGEKEYYIGLPLGDVSGRRISRPS